MKKIYLLITLALFILITNFFLWFWQTKIITENFEEFKKTLALNNIKLSYSEPRFTTFRSWQVDGNLENVEITYGKAVTTTLNINSLKFYSQPFNKNIRFKSSKIINVINTSSTTNDIYQIMYGENLVPTLKIDFDISFSKLLEVFKTTVRKPIYTYIKHLQFNNPEFNIVKANTNISKINVKNIMLDLISQRDKKSREFIINLVVGKIKYNPNYISENDFDNMEQNLCAELGDMNLTFNVTYKELPSTKQLEYLKTIETKNVDPVFDTFNIDLKTLAFTSDKFNIDILSNIEKQPDFLIPAGNLKISINNYNYFFDYFVKNINLLLSRFSAENPFLQISLINEEKTNKFKDYLVNFKPENDMITFDINRLPNEEIKINNYPALNVFSDLQKIYSFSSVDREVSSNNNY